VECIAVVAIPAHRHRTLRNPDAEMADDARDDQIQSR
jgi:hypothetical protein